LRGIANETIYSQLRVTIIVLGLGSVTMAKTKQAATSDGKARDNSAIELPEDRAEAMRWIYERVLRLSNEKRAVGERVRDELKDAKASKHEVAAVRMAARLRRMTPEKRDKWERTINAAAAFLGYSPLSLDDMPKLEEMPGGEHVARVESLERERAETSGEIGELYAAAKAAGLDVVSLRLFVRMAGMDAIEKSEWFDAVDMAGKALGIWGENFDDLNADTF
jgi:uncharacterized protein (UPF0335 family)